MNSGNSMAPKIKKGPLHNEVDQQPVIVCGADNNFAMPLAITLFSAFVNLREGAVQLIYVIDGGISTPNKARVNNVLKNAGKGFKLAWIPYDLSIIKTVQVTAIISKAAYLRILIADLLPSVHDKAIYLDCDMIVEADLAALWEIQFSGEPAMAVQDFFYPFVSTDDAIINYKAYSIRADATYCNSGLMVLNLSYWRANKVSSKIFNYLALNVTTLKHFDQDGINAVIAGKWKLLNPRWNVSLSSVAVFGKELNLTQEKLEWYREKFFKNPYIIHYTSRHKPWHTGHKNREALTVYYFDQYYRNRYFYYLQKSGWFGGAKFRAWALYRKFILAVEFKLPRRLGLLNFI